jgi:hypothetical protein
MPRSRFHSMPTDTPLRLGRLFVFLLPLVPLAAQDAGAGIDLRATISGEAIYANQLTDSPRDGTALDAAFRAVVYPLIRLDEHWTVEGAVQVSSNPYFTEDFTTPGHGVRTRILRANLGYSRSWKSASISIHAGQLGSAIGSFNLRYDDAVNPLIDVPILYGYWTKITTMGVAGVETDVTVGKWDARAQFVNSSMMDPRSIFDRDQYGNWAGGAGYTIFQGLRVGISGSRGPYLNRQWPNFFPGEANPNRLPGSNVGTELQFARGHWNVDAEWAWMLMPYHVIPFTRREGAYIEAKRALTPRWYVAVRDGYLCTNGDCQQVYEGAAGFRPGVHELVKFGYEVERDGNSGHLNPIAMVQFVTTVHPFSLGWH